MQKVFLNLNYDVDFFNMFGRKHQAAHSVYMYAGPIDWSCSVVSVVQLLNATVCKSM